MADMLNRTTLQFIRSVNTPDFPVSVWVINPDMSPVTGVLPKYWLLTDDILSEMDAAQKAVVDAAEAAAATAAKQAEIAAQLTSDPLNGLTITAIAEGLSITTNIEKLVVNDVTAVVADPTDTKFVKVCYVYDEDTNALRVAAYEKTTGQYALFTPPEYLVKQLGEWSVAANGTELVEV